MRPIESPTEVLEQYNIKTTANTHLKFQLQQPTLLELVTSPTPPFSLYDYTKE